MDLCSKVCRGMLIILGTASIWASASAARADDDYHTRYQPFALDFNEAVSRSSGTALKAQSLFGQFSIYFGISYPWPNTLNAFPETLIADDAKRVNRVYQEALLRQVSSDPIMRTPDLINPFNTSILTQPTFID